MPIINWISVLESTEKGKEKDLERLAEERMDEAANLRLAINDKSIPLSFTNFRVQSISDNIILPQDNIFDIEPGLTSFVADGFWIYFKPLTLDLTLETYGSCQSGAIQIASKYHMITRII